MCGLFGYIGDKSIALRKVFDILAELEIAKLPQESSPVGGDGAGLALINHRTEIIKVGRKDKSPVSCLRQKVLKSQSSAIFGHVRRASQQFKDRVAFAECTQPYLANCTAGTEVVCIHNGFFQNYQGIFESLQKFHALQSPKVELVDSEVIPHYFEELLSREDCNSAVDHLFQTLQGPGNALSLWVKKDKKRWLILLYKGSARGLYVWRNPAGNIFFASRREPILDYMTNFLKKNLFSLTISIEPKTHASLQEIYTF